MQVQYCTKPDHKLNPLNLVCLDQECPLRGLCCGFCVLDKHKSHSAKVLPLKKVFQALNKANNPKVKDELGIIGNDILKRHCNIFSKFRRYVTAIQESIKKLETAIEKKMKELQEESQVFVGNLLEKSMEKLNDPNVKTVTIQEELQKLFPLIQVSATNPEEIECLGLPQKQIEAERITRLAELLERECRFWIEKSLEDLKKLENNILIATRQKPILKMSENRFGGSNIGWTLNDTEAVTFEVNKSQDVWLTGMGIFEITKWPEKEKSVQFKVNILQGGATTDKMIYEQTLELSADKQPNENHIIKLDLKQAVKLETKQSYTITMKPNKQCISYYGFNGCSETQDFIFRDTIFQEDIRSNSSGQVQGQFPIFYFEE